MKISKMALTSDAALPLIAALPYGITLDAGVGTASTYDPVTQLTCFASRDFSTCRVDESVGILNSKSDTQKDD